MTMETKQKQQDTGMADSESSLWLAWPMADDVPSGGMVKRARKIKVISTATTTTTEPTEDSKKTEADPSSSPVPVAVGGIRVVQRLESYSDEKWSEVFRKQWSEAQRSQETYLDVQMPRARQRYCLLTGEVWDGYNQLICMIKWRGELSNGGVDDGFDFDTHMVSPDCFPWSKGEWKRLQEHMSESSGSCTSTSTSTVSKPPVRFGRLPLHERNADAKRARDLFGLTCDHRVVRVEKMIHPDAWRQYLARRGQLLQAATANDTKNGNDQGIQERWVFHGTSANNVDRILEHGFDRDKNRRSVYGKGIYLARSGAYSASPLFAPVDAQGHQHVLLCCLATHRPMVMTENQQLNVDVADHGVDSLGHPSIFVVRHEAQVVPLYHLIFQS